MKQLTCLFLFTLVLAINGLTTWQQWNQPGYAPSWSYNTSWTPPPTNTGFTRNVNSSSNSPYDNDFTIRYNQYLWKNSSNKKYCAPESYLETSGVFCKKNPKYWNPALGVDCYPNINNTPCTPAKNPLSNYMPCCYHGYNEIGTWFIITNLVLDPTALNL